MIESLIGIVIGIGAIGVILCAAARFLLFVSRMRGRRPMATYTRRWPVTRA